MHTKAISVWLWNKRLYVLKVCNVPHSTLEEHYKTDFQSFCMPKMLKKKVNFDSNIIFFWFCFEKTWWWPRLKVQVSPETSFKTCNPQFIVFLANFHLLIKVSMKSKLMFKGFYQMFVSIPYLYTSIRPNNGKKVQVFSLLSTSCSALSNSRQIDLLVAKVTGNYNILYSCIATFCSIKWLYSVSLFLSMNMN